MAFHDIQIDKTKPLWHNYFLCGLKGIQVNIIRIKLLNFYLKQIYCTFIFLGSWFIYLLFLLFALFLCPLTFFSVWIAIGNTQLFPYMFTNGYRRASRFKIVHACASATNGVRLTIHTHLFKNLYGFPF